MKLLREINDSIFGADEIEKLGEEYTLMKSARAILVNDVGEMAVQYLSRDRYHKLPGGGVEQGETLPEALKREIMEEVGCACEITGELGLVIEYRNKHSLLQISYGFSAIIAGEVGETALEQGEQEEGMSAVWMNPVQALQQMQSDTPKTYKGKFHLQREIAFLEEYLKVKNS